jgi:alpha-beta hydrolase superfamily lysophospholipase
LYPARRPLAGTPRLAGLDYFDVTFPSSDGLTLRGWWLPAEAPVEAAPVVVLLHPLFGNRLGSARPAAWPGLAQPEVDLLPVAAAFHAAHYAVLLFDFRGHGESERGLCGGGLTEDQDVAGAVDFAFARAGAAPRVGVVGFGLGAAAALAAVGRYKGGTETTWVFSGDSEGGSDWTKILPANVKQLSFLAAVQPVSPGTLLRSRLRRVSGPLSGLLAALVSQFSVWLGGYPLNPGALLKFAAGVTVPVLLVQPRGTPEGDCRELQALFDAVPAPKRLAWAAAPGGSVEDPAAFVASVLAFAAPA